MYGVWRDMHGGRRCWHKRRRAIAAPLALVANALFSNAGCPARFFASTRAWQQRELESFALLNAPALRARAVDRAEVCLGEVPGTSLRELAAIGRLDAAAARAAGRELARAHHLTVPGEDATWTHGDAHIGNVFYDALTDRAWLIDFEQRHDPRASALERRADDLLACLLDMLGRVGDGLWPAAGVALVEGYGDPAVAAHLRDQLVMPHGARRVVWGARSNHADDATLARRLGEVRAGLDATTSDRRHPFPRPVLRARAASPRGR